MLVHQLGFGCDPCTVTILLSGTVVTVECPKSISTCHVFPFPTGSFKTVMRLVTDEDVRFKIIAITFVDTAASRSNTNSASSAWVQPLYVRFVI